MTNQPQIKSTFVTTLAWIFIICSGFALLISIAQNVMVNTFFSVNDFSTDSLGSDAKSKQPAFFEFMTSNMQLFFAILFVLTAVMFTSSVGLLKRKKWARNIFVIMMGICILWNIASIGIQQFMQSDMNQFLNNPKIKANSEIEEFKSMMIFMEIFTILISLAFSLLFAWIIKKLVTAPIKHEFQ